MFVTPASLLSYNWPRRYNVQPADFQNFQGSLFAMARGMSEGLLGAAVLEGFALSLSGMQVTAGSGIAVGPSGYLDVLPTSTTVTVAAPATGTTRNLIVVQPNMVTGTIIQDPVNPNVSDVLTQVQQAVVSVIAGVAATSPVYPAVPAGATVLCGVRATAGQVSLATADIDLTVQDTVGKNSNFNHIVGVNDDRLLPYAAGTPSLGIKPSQTLSPAPKAFTYVSATQPSIWPKSGGSFNPADTFVNFQTGVISGGDTTSSAFTPTIPTAGNAIVAAIGITTSDLLSVAYGTQGTRAQCFAGIINQTSVGAGAVALPASTKLVAFVVLTSADGVNITELDFVDARSFSAAVAQTPYPNYDLVIGNIQGANFATLAAAVASGTTGAGLRVLLADSQALANSAVNLTKADWQIDMLPGKTYTSGGSSCKINIQASGISFNRCRFANFSTSGVFGFNGSGAYVRINDCRFNNCTATPVDTSGAPTGNSFPVEEGSIVE